MFTAGDRAQREELGISAEEVDRQVRLFERPPPPIQLDRPCRVGDGIRVLGAAERDAALRAYEAARGAGRLQKFVPASGAATRMFQALLGERHGGADLTRDAIARRAEAGGGDARELLTFLDNLPRFAFYEDLCAVLARRGEDLDALLARGRCGEILDGLLAAGGLNYAALPKGLLPFHRYPDGSRTAFEEHLVDGAEYGRADCGDVGLHFTVSPEHRAAFEALFAGVRPRCERRGAARFAVGFSTQKRSTDTLAVDLDNRPIRTADGRLLFRPGGHGALIENLNDLRGDVVFIQNIDNVQPDHRRGEALEWRRLLTGHLLVVQRAAGEHLAALAAEPGAARIDAARRFVAEAFGVAPPDGVAGDPAAARAWLAHRLDRPLRACGMVRNTGEPGGGPFWVRGEDGGCSPQIVEGAQVDPGSEEQRGIFAAATHFNPVALACGLRDHAGRPFDLRGFVDPAAVFLTHKSKDGRALKALERPGLWNGAMAHWNTVFVQVSDATFTPVKTVNDLLRPEHQPPDEEARGAWKR